MQPLDYPEPFRGTVPGSKRYAHPTDYKISTEYIKPEVFLYKGAGGRGRLFFRTSICLREGSDVAPSTYTNATFFVDTGACPELAVCDELYDLMSPRIKQSFRFDFIESDLNDKKRQLVVSKAVQEYHKPANLIGLPMLFLLGFKFPTCEVDGLDHDLDRVVKNVVDINEFKFL